MEISKSGFNSGVDRLFKFDTICESQGTVCKIYWGIIGKCDNMEIKFIFKNNIKEKEYSLTTDDIKVPGRYILYGKFTNKSDKTVVTIEYIRKYE